MPTLKDFLTAATTRSGVDFTVAAVQKDAFGRAVSIRGTIEGVGSVYWNMQGRAFGGNTDHDLVREMSVDAYELEELEG